jgi:hypothetical protein
MAETTYQPAAAGLALPGAILRAERSPKNTLQIVSRWSQSLTRHWRPNWCAFYGTKVTTTALQGFGLKPSRRNFSNMRKKRAAR